jgi:hypothetical protein
MWMLVLHHVISSEINEKCVLYKGQWNEKQKITVMRRTSELPGLTDVGVKTL